MFADPVVVAPKRQRRGALHHGVVTGITGEI
jgi:hypothetical protein